jgi:hypothetical protein
LRIGVGATGEERRRMTRKARVSCTVGEEWCPMSSASETRAAKLAHEAAA